MEVYFNFKSIVFTGKKVIDLLQQLTQTDYRQFIWVVYECFVDKNVKTFQNTIFKILLHIFDTVSAYKRKQKGHNK